ncbi:hypothetical protein GU90_08360 [Saccharopolyspora rectivirgula]|uniref:Prepilin type IV endopeptidase peptidase domain-containing protein n=1 Tax=Saccharopolyspora rectivirgula TaxID=28042 RepID=A0A073B0H0_9PSEU|nr:hypothetical protein GU90_08360 [Saccharopolyspora rectivirgula]
MVFFAAAGFAAGAAGRCLLGRVRRGIRAPGWCCEIAVALLWAMAAAGALLTGLPWWWMPVPLVTGWFAVLLAVCDLLVRRLPDFLTLPAYPVAAALVGLMACQQPARALPALVGALLFAGAYLLVRVVLPGSLGAGDVKLAGSLGLVTGAVSFAAVLGTMLAAAVLTLLVARQRNRSVPHGPLMLAPAWVSTAFPALVGGWP